MGGHRKRERRMRYWRHLETDGITHSELCTIMQRVHALRGVAWRKLLELAPPISSLRYVAEHIPSYRHRALAVIARDTSDVNDLRYVFVESVYLRTVVAERLLDIASTEEEIEEFLGQLDRGERSSLARRCLKLGVTRSQMRVFIRMNVERRIMTRLLLAGEQSNDDLFYVMQNIIKHRLQAARVLIERDPTREQLRFIFETEHHLRERAADMLVAMGLTDDDAKLIARSLPQYRERTAELTGSKEG